MAFAALVTAAATTTVIVAGSFRAGTGTPTETTAPGQLGTQAADPDPDLDPASIGGGPAASPERTRRPPPSGSSDRTAPPDAGSELVLAVLRAQALARIDYPWQQRLPGWDIDFVGPRAGFLGATMTNERRIEIYVDGRRTVDELSFTVAHELGHAVDLTLLEGDERDRWLTARGAAGKAWWAANAESDYAVGAGDWAEAFAVWQLGGRGYSTLAGPPTKAQLAMVADLASAG